MIENEDNWDLTTGILAYVAVGDSRTYGELDILQWMRVLPDGLTVDDAREAIEHHRATSTDWLQPRHIIEYLDARRRVRLRDANAGIIPYPGGLSLAEEKQFRELYLAAVGEGSDPKEAAVEAAERMTLPPEPERVGPPPEVRELLARNARAKDPVAAFGGRPHTGSAAGPIIVPEPE